MCKRFYSCDIMLVSILVDTRGVGRLGGGKCLVVRSVGVVMTTTLADISTIRYIFIMKVFHWQTGNRSSEAKRSIHN